MIGHVIRDPNSEKITRKLKSVSEIQIILTRKLEIDERGSHLSAGLRVRVFSDGFGREAIELRTEATSPAPLIEVAEVVEVGPAVLAPRQKVSVGAVRRRTAFLVLGGERRHRHAPREPRALLGVGVDRKPRHRGSHRHGLEIVSVINVLSFIFW